jgi:hypothetical protein
MRGGFGGKNKKFQENSAFEVSQSQKEKGVKRKR